MGWGNLYKISQQSSLRVTESYFFLRPLWGSGVIYVCHGNLSNGWHRIIRNRWGYSSFVDNVCFVAVIYSRLIVCSLFFKAWRKALNRSIAVTPDKLSINDFKSYSIPWSEITALSIDEINLSLIHI